jgi:hypothetical protein
MISNANVFRKYMNLLNESSQVKEAGAIQSPFDYLHDPSQLEPKQEKTPAPFDEKKAHSAFARGFKAEFGGVLADNTGLSQAQIPFYNVGIKLGSQARKTVGKENIPVAKVKGRFDSMKSNPAFDRIAKEQGLKAWQDPMVRELLDTDVTEAKKPKQAPKSAMHFNSAEFPKTLARFMGVFMSGRAAEMQKQFTEWNVSSDPSNGDVKLIVGYNPTSKEVEGWVFYENDNDAEDMGGSLLDIIKNLKKSGCFQLAYAMQDELVDTKDTM